MQSMNARAREMLPQVLLTLLSMIQAIALELLWSRIHESPHLRVPDWAGITGWLQMATILIGFLQIWLFYTSLVMRFTWRPTMLDSLIPFAIGALEFMLVDLAGPETIPAFFTALAVVYGITSWSSHDVFRRARRDPANREFFERVAPATLRDFVPTFAAVGGLLVFAFAVRLTGGPGPLAATAFLATAGMLVHQIVLTHRYWETSLGPETPIAARE